MDTEVMFQLDRELPQTGVLRRPPAATGAFHDIVRQEVEALVELKDGIQAQLDEMDALATLMAAEVRAANSRASKLQHERDVAMAVTDGLLRQRQLETAAVMEAIAHFKVIACDERSKTLIKNLERALKGS